MKTVPRSDMKSVASQVAEREQKGDCMSYYDRWDDRNREAKRRGEKDAFYGTDHRYEYDAWGERRAAYQDGYQEERRMLERREEERREEEMAFRRERDRRCAEEEYHRQMEEAYYAEQEQQEMPEPEQEHE